MSQLAAKTGIEFLQLCDNLCNLLLVGRSATLEYQLASILLRTGLAISVVVWLLHHNAKTPPMKMTPSSNPNNFHLPLGPSSVFLSAAAKSAADAYRSFGSIANAFTQIVRRSTDRLFDAFAPEAISVLRTVGKSDE